MRERFIKLLKSINPDIIDSGSNSLVDDGIIDSMNVMQIVIAVEEEFSISIDLDDLSPENFQSVDSLISMISKYINN